MKSNFFALVMILLLLSACSKPEAPRYAADSPEYAFFKKLSEKAPILNPDEVNELIHASKFAITTNDIMPDIYRGFGGNANNLESMPEDRIKMAIQQTAVRLADKQLLLCGAADEKISVSDELVNTKLEEIYATNGGKEAFIDRIGQQGFTIEYVEKDVRENLIITEFQKSASSGEPTEEEVRDAYDADKTASVRHILMLTQGKTDSVKKVIYGEMEKLLERARAGEDFAALAKEYTEDPGSKENGGLYEDFPRGRMVKPFEDAAFNLEIGSISDIVETTYGYHILKIENRKKETLPFEEVKEEISKKLKNTKSQNAFRNLMESLKEKYKYEQVYI